MMSLRALAALMPLTEHDLAAIVNRRGLRGHESVTAEDVAAAAESTPLLRIRDGVVWLAQPVSPHPADAVLVWAAVASERFVHTYPQVRELLSWAGHEWSPAATLTYDPLLIHVLRGWWAIRLPVHLPTAGITTST